jgi:Ni/Co efflux regulator RcnB
MKKAFIYAIALGLAAAAPAYAQDNNDNDNNRHHGQHQGDNDRGDHDRNNNDSNGGGGGGGGGNDNDNDNDHHAGNGGRHDHDRNDNDRDVNVNVHRNVHTNVHRNVIVRGRGGADITRFRAVIRAPHRFRIGVWHAPRGFHYRRFVLGERIPRLLLAPTFYLTAYGTYGLMAPPEGYIWVRVGSDAVLVDRDSGEVIRVVYGVFY